MRTSRRVGYDYAVDVYEGPDLVVESLKLAFERKWNLVTEADCAYPGRFISVAAQPTLGRTILRGIPARLDWKVSAISSRKSRILANFALPRLPHLRVYLIVLLFSSIYFVIARSLVSWGNTQPPDSAFAPGCLLLLVSLIAGCLTLLGSWHFLNLLDRYRRALRLLMSDIASELDRQYETVYRKPGRSQRRHWIDWKMAPILIGFFLLATWASGALHGRELWPPGTPQSWCLLLSAVGVLLIGSGILLTAMRGSFSARMASPSAAVNLILTYVVSLCLLGIPWVQEYVVQQCLLHLGHQDILSRSEGYRLVNAAPRRGNLPSSDLLPDAMVEMVTWLTVLAMYLFPLFILAVSVFVLVINSQIWIDYGRRTTSEHQRALASIHRLYGSAETRVCGLRTSAWVMKCAVWCLFLGCALVCWLGVLLSLSLAFALIWPGKHPVILTDGECLVQGATTLASKLLNRRGDETAAVIWGATMVIPTLFPFLFLVAGHVRFGILSRMRRRSWSSLDADLAESIHRMASEVGVSRVFCYRDDSSSALSPYADIRGVVPKRVIVFSPRAVELLRDNPEYLPAILAHEFGHLQYDCRWLRCLRIISRVGLTGVGFLGVLLDPLAMEDRADRFARRYLREHGLDESLIPEAAAAIEVRSYLAKVRSAPLTGAAFQLCEASEPSTDRRHSRSLWREVKVAFSIAYTMYFDMELYHYLHREARQRRARARYDVSCRPPESQPS